MKVKAPNLGALQKQFWFWKATWNPYDGSTIHDPHSRGKIDLWVSSIHSLKAWYLKYEILWKIIQDGCVMSHRLKWDNGFISRLVWAASFRKHH